MGFSSPPAAKTCRREPRRGKARFAMAAPGFCMDMTGDDSNNPPRNSSAHNAVFR